MCGITGYVQTNPGIALAQWQTVGKPLLTKLFNAISARGTDASGFAMLKGNILSVVKHRVSTPAMIQKALYQTKLNGPPELFIGHSRAATQGSPNRNINNHPFVSRDRRYALVHNGMVISGQDKVEELLDLKLKSNCDSELYLRIIEKLGIYEGAKFICTTLKHSMFALLILDSWDKVLHFFRGSAAPIIALDLAEEAGGTFLVSTEMLLWKGLINVLQAGQVWKTIKHAIEPHQYVLYSWPVNVPTPYRFFDERMEKLKLLENNPKKEQKNE